MIKNKAVSFLLTFILTIVLVQAPCYNILGAEGETADGLANAAVVSVGSSKAYVGGKEVRVDSTNPNLKVIQEKGVVLVPLAFISDNFNVKLKWNETYNAVTLSSDDRYAKLTIGSDKAEINNSEVNLGCAVDKREGKIFIPLRLICENLLEKDVSYYKGLVIIGDRDVSVNTSGNIAKLDEYHDKLKYENLRIPILMYHHFQEEIPENLGGTTVTPQEFEENLSYLNKKGYNSITFAELFNFMVYGAELPQNPFILTIDDGYTSNYDLAYPLLKKYKTKATISIVTSSVGQTPGEFPHFTWEQAKEMEDSGLVEIQNHGFLHINHGNMSYDELVNDVETAQEDIENHLGKRPLKVFAYPEGLCSDNSRHSLAELGFKIQLTDFDSIVSKNTDLSNIRRINVRHGMNGKEIEDTIQKIIDKEKKKL